MPLQLSTNLSDLRRANNHTVAQGGKWRDLARDVAQCYGRRFERSVRYLEQLAANEFWATAELRDFPWLSLPPNNQRIHEARFVMHPAVVNALAPAMPLRAAFGGDRRA